MRKSSFLSISNNIGMLVSLPFVPKAFLALFNTGELWGTNAFQKHPRETSGQEKLLD